MTNATAQETKTDPQIDRLTREKKIAELELEIAKLNAERLRLILPKAETKALEGKISVDEKFALPSQILTYHTASQIARQASADIASALPNLKTVVVHSEKELSAIAVYVSTLAQINALEERYDELLRAKAAVAPAVALLAPELLATVLRSIADVVALFRTDVEIKATTVAVDDVAVIAELARGLRETKPDVRLVYPPTYLPRQLLQDPVGGSDLVKKLNRLLQDRRQAAEVIAVFEAKSTEDQKKDPIRNNIPRLKTLNDQTDKFISALTTPDEKAGVSALTVLLKAELLKSILSDENAAVVYVKVNAAGGSNKTTRNLFAGTKLFHSGGSVITFMAFDAQGGVGFSKTFFFGTEFVNFDDEEQLKLRKNF